MKTIHPKYPRILAIAPSSPGFSFAVLEDRGTLVDWGGRSVTGKKNKGSLLKSARLISRYRPDVLVLEDTSAEGSLRAPRIRRLSKQIAAMATKHQVSVKLFSRKAVKKALFADGKGTKHDIATVIAEGFPDELGSLLPPKRRTWDSEDPRLDIFIAVALAVVYRLRKAKLTACRIEYTSQ